MNNIIEKLIDKNKTISVMESCTGGKICDSITNITGSSKVFKFGAVTYSDEYKIKLGVKKSTIDKFGVYSIEVAREMSQSIAQFTNSDYGIGVTGELSDLEGDKTIYISFYIKEKAAFVDAHLELTTMEREKKKEILSRKIIEIMYKNIE